MVFTNMVTSDYFRTLGIRVLRGRPFDAHDSAAGQKVAIVNRSLARFFFGNADPIGRPVHFYRDEGNPLTIVGVVEDATQRSLRLDPPMTVYTPLAQLSQPEALITVALKTRQDPLALAGVVRPAVNALSPSAVVSYVRTMEEQIGVTLVRERLLALLSTAFGALALVLSCIGLYGVVSYDVTRTMRELGIRVALGARRGDVLRQVLRRALSVSSAGVLFGLLVTIAAIHVLSTLLFGITARDPLTLSSAALLLVLTTVAASYIPARRAARVDPVVVLRMD
jgi:predicted permease